MLARLENPGPFLLREVGRIRAVGKTEIVEVHEVLAVRPASEAQQAATTRETFAAALAAWYRADFRSAAELFAACSRDAPSGDLALKYTRRSEMLAAEPPNGEWLGVEVMR